jgi:hypothetical protein
VGCGRVGSGTVSAKSVALLHGILGQGLGWGEAGLCQGGSTAPLNGILRWSCMEPAGELSTQGACWAVLLQYCMQQCSIAEGDHGTRILLSTCLIPSSGSCVTTQLCQWLCTTCLESTQCSRYARTSHHTAKLL